MKKKYYKLIIDTLQEKLDSKSQECGGLYNRFVEAEAENKMLRNELAELSKEFFKSKDENDNN